MRQNTPPAFQMYTIYATYRTVKTEVSLESNPPPLLIAFRNIRQDLLNILGAFLLMQWIQMYRHMEETNNQF